ncbi:hypothetical protein BV898_16954 [Hypsibius exemplaris]|uniref:Uncharacterized protein n=1 Tax=Hypsibius exemplaris TaxID=2072580 RepID=A0A9X6NEF9_HYPEX|nr:hypothetical protein BV898_16954 [Hypsibius exemplaris]
MVRMSTCSDLGVSVKESSQTISDAQFAFPLEGLNSLDIFSFVVDAKASGPNLQCPAVLDSFRNLMEFSRRLGGDLSNTSLSTAVASYGNRLVSVAAPQPVQLQLLPGSKFHPTKKRKIQFDFKIPLTASFDDAGMSSSFDSLKQV